MIARLIAPFLPVISSVLLVAALGLAGALWWQSSTIESLRADKASLELTLSGCEARSQNILKDKESDDAIDRMPDSDLPNVPPEWMLPPPSGAK